MPSAQPDFVIASVHYITSRIPVERGRLFDERYWRAYMDEGSRSCGSQVDVVGHIAGFARADAASRVHI